MLTRFEAHGYRNLDTSVALGRCTVLVGPNNCGKSNLMRALCLPGDVVNGGEASWESALRSHGGLQLVDRALRTSGAWTRGDAHVQLGGTWSSESLEVDLSLRVSGTPDGRAVAGGSTFAFRDSSSSSSKPTNDKENAALASRMVGDPLHLSLASLAPKVVTRAWSDEGDSGRSLLDDARNLPAHLQFLTHEHSEGLTGMTDVLRELLPELRRIWVRSPAGSGATWVELVMAGEKEGTPLRDFSDGTVVALLLATLLHGPQKRNLLLLDEPELNLHPAWLKVLSRWLVRPTAAEQVVFSTHSTDLLDALTPGFRSGEVEVLVADTHRGFRNLTLDEVQPFFDDGYELGDLYRMGEPKLGGWPW